MKTEERRKKKTKKTTKKEGILEKKKGRKVHTLTVRHISYNQPGESEGALQNVQLFLGG